MIINDVIKELMYEQDKDIKDIMIDTNLSLSTIYNIVNNNINPTPKEAHIIFKSLGVSLDNILSLY